MKVLTILLLLVSAGAAAQGHIDNIKNQPYLKYKNQVNCGNPIDNLSMRVCANLAFQASDSLLVIEYTKLLTRSASLGIDSARTKVERMQTTWRTMRFQQCDLIADSWAGGSGQAVAFLSCMKQLTDSRTKELKSLTEEIAGR